MCHLFKKKKIDINAYSRVILISTVSEFNLQQSRRLSLLVELRQLSETKRFCSKTEQIEVDSLFLAGQVVLHAVHIFIERLEQWLRV